MPNNADKIAIGKPKVSGAIYAAPDETAVPEDAASDLNAAFKCLGYVTEDGMTNSDKKTTEKMKAWGGDVVKQSVTEHVDTFKFKLMECLNEEVLKFVYGAANVSGSVAAGLTIKSNAKETEKVALVVEMILGDVPKRIVVPHAQVTEVSDIVYKDSDAVVYETTVSAYPDEKGNTHYEYIGGGAQQGS